MNRMWIAMGTLIMILGGPVKVLEGAPQRLEERGWVPEYFTTLGMIKKSLRDLPELSPLTPYRNLFVQFSTELSQALSQWLSLGRPMTALPEAFRHPTDETIIGPICEAIELGSHVVVLSVMPPGAYRLPMIYVFERQANKKVVLLTLDISMAEDYETTFKGLNGLYLLSSDSPGPLDFLVVVGSGQGVLELKAIQWVFNPFTNTLTRGWTHTWKDDHHIRVTYKKGQLVMKCVRRGYNAVKKEKEFWEVTESYSYDTIRHVFLAPTITQLPESK